MNTGGDSQQDVKTRPAFDVKRIGAAPSNSSPSEDKPREEELPTVSLDPVKRPVSPIYEDDEAHETDEEEEYDEDDEKIRDEEEEDEEDDEKSREETEDEAAAVEQPVPPLASANDTLRIFDDIPLVPLEYTPWRKTPLMLSAVLSIPPIPEDEHEDDFGDDAFPVANEVPEPDPEPEPEPQTAPELQPAAAPLPPPPPAQDPEPAPVLQALLSSPEPKPVEITFPVDSDDEDNEEKPATDEMVANPAIAAVLTEREVNFDDPLLPSDDEESQAHFHPQAVTVTIRTIRSKDTMTETITSFHKLMAAVDGASQWKHKKLRKAEDSRDLFVPLSLDVLIDFHDGCADAPSIWSSWDSTTLRGHSIERITIQSQTLDPRHVVPSVAALQRCTTWVWNIPFGMPAFGEMEFPQKESAFDFRVHTGYVIMDSRANLHEMQSWVANCTRFNVGVEFSQPQGARAFFVRSSSSSHAWTTHSQPRLKEVFIDSKEMSAWFMTAQSTIGIEEYGISYPVPDDVVTLGCGALELDALHGVVAAAACTALSVQLPAVQRAVLDVDIPAGFWRVPEPARPMMMGVAEFAFLAVPLAASLLRAARSPPGKPVRLEIRLRNALPVAVFALFNRLAHGINIALTDFRMTRLVPAIIHLHPPPTVQRLHPSLRGRTVMQHARHLTREAMGHGVVNLHQRPLAAGPRPSTIVSNTISMAPGQCAAWENAIVLAIGLAARGFKTLSTIIQGMFTNWKPTHQRIDNFIQAKLREAVFVDTEVQVLLRSASLQTDLVLPRGTRNNPGGKQVIVFIE